MSEDINKPKVFPTQKEIDEANQLSERLNQEIFAKLSEDGAYDELNKQIVEKNELPDTRPQVSQGELDAAAEMKRKTDELIKLRDENNGQRPYVVRPDLAEPTSYQAEIKYGQEKTQTAPKPVMSNFQYNGPVEDNKAPEMNDISQDKFNEQMLAALEAKYEKLGQPQANVPFDVIPLPSRGKLYANKKPTMKIAYLNASDENILTNPNLLESGRFLEILINRKMMDTNIRYKDLHVGDRNAIMIWLRSTAYGAEYPIQVFDPATGRPFETNIDLSQLKMIELEADCDAKGYISFVLPLSKNEIKFRLLTVGDLDEIDAHTEAVTAELGAEFIDTSTYILKKHIVSVNGYTNRADVDDFVDQMLLGDVKAFRKYVDEIESGMDMNLTVGTPGGESIKTFLPLNVSFFWPDL